jgi:hydrogenase nickel incorporation protein HypA/HybF
MHEAGIAQAILDTVLRSLPAGRPAIRRISVAVGVFSGVERDSLDLWLTELSKGTPAEGAVLDVRRQSARLVCKTCGHVESYDNDGDLHVRCVRCDAVNAMEGGNELSVESIEVDT